MTDTELRERVARIANEICGCATPEQRRRDIALIEAEIDRRVAEEKAKLLAGLRTPSEGMLEAGGHCEGVILDDFDGVVVFPRRVWKAMLAQFERENSDG